MLNDAGGVDGDRVTFRDRRALTWLERFEGGGVARERLHVFLLKEICFLGDDDDDDDDA